MMLAQPLPAGSFLLNGWVFVENTGATAASGYCFMRGAGAGTSRLAVYYSLQPGAWIQLPLLAAANFAAPQDGGIWCRATAGQAVVDGAMAQAIQVAVLH